MNERSASTTSTRDFRRIASAIQFLAERWMDHPSPADLAAHVGVSRFHFQRMFRQWAGISPARFAQLFALKEAQSMLAEGASILDVSLDVGLSGPSRLHDLFVTFEALSPGEFKRLGDGLELVWGRQSTPFGDALFARSSRGLCHVEFLVDDDEEGVLERLARLWPRAVLTRDDDATTADAMSLSTRRTAPLDLHVVGTNFQVQVWRALLHIPEAAAATYGQIAKAIRKPGAARAVGNAAGENPIAALIPCHRVLRTSGAIGGYRWGEGRKRALIAWELGRAEAAKRRA